MNTELRKRLEKAAEQHAIQTLAYFAQHNQTPTHFDWADKVKEEYIAGAEFGYKEAVNVAKEWLEVKIGNYLGLIHEAELTASTFRTAQLITDFEADMLKLLEAENGSTSL